MFHVPLPPPVMTATNPLAEKISDEILISIVYGVEANERKLLKKKRYRDGKIKLLYRRMHFAR
jgi:hypothetical protein